MSFLPGMSAAVSTATTPGAARTASRSSARKRSRRLVGHADGDMQRARGLADVVDIGRGAAHMQARGIVRMRLVDDRGLDFQRHDGNERLSIRQHGALPGGSARRRRRFPSARAATDWRRLRCDRRRSRACR